MQKKFVLLFVLALFAELATAFNELDFDSLTIAELEAADFTNAIEATNATEVTEPQTGKLMNQANEML